MKETKTTTPWGVVKKINTNQLFIIQSLDDDKPLAEVFSSESDANVMAGAKSLVQTVEHVITVLSTLDAPYTNRDLMIERCIMFLNDAVKVTRGERK